MKPCHRPLDPIDVEAVAAGADPVFAADAAAHVRECASCRGQVEVAASLSKALDGLSEASEAISGLADRVARLRTFSRKERRTYAFWSAPVTLTVALAATGLGLLAVPVLTAAEQVSVGAAAIAPVLALARGASRSVFDLLVLAPGGLEALAEGLRREGTLGLAALALLVPIGLGLRRALSRAHARR